MAITDLPMLSALRTKMQWHQERQRVLAENVSHSDTPNFKPRDLVEPKFDASGTGPVTGNMPSLSMTRTSAGHIQGAGASDTFNDVGRQTVGKGLDLAPTLTVRPGAPVRVIVTRDLILEPYESPLP